MPDIFFGQNASFQLISMTHGAKKLAFCEAFEVDPSHSNKRLYFFNTKESLAISIFEGVNGRFGYLETQEKYFLAMIMDQDPGADVINDDPGAYLEFNILIQARNEVGTQRQSIFCKGCRISGVPENLAPREEQHTQVGFIGRTRYKLKGGGIQYSRVLAAVPDPTVFTTPDDLNFDGTGKVTLPETPLDVNIYDRSTVRNWMAVYKNGEDMTQTVIDDPSIFTLSNTTGDWTLAAGAPLATDVWEIYTPFKV